MTKFVVTKNVPENLSKDCYVIRYPDFMEEILANKRREPRGNITANAHLRFITGTIAEKYDPTNHLGAAIIRPHLFEGRTYSNDEELSKIIVEMLESQYHSIFEKYLAYKVKHRPMNVKVIYWTGPYQMTTPFFQHGLDKLDENEVENYLNGDKTPKKNAKGGKND